MLSPVTLCLEHSSTFFWPPKGGPIHSLAWLRLAPDVTPEPSLELAPSLSLVDERGWGRKVHLRRLAPLREESHALGFGMAAGRRELELRSSDGEGQDTLSLERAHLHALSLPISHGDLGSGQVDVPQSPSDL